MCALWTYYRLPEYVGKTPSSHIVVVRILTDVLCSDRSAAPTPNLMCCSKPRYPHGNLRLLTLQHSTAHSTIPLFPINKLKRMCVNWWNIQTSHEKNPWAMTSRGHLRNYIRKVYGSGTVTQGPRCIQGRDLLSVSRVSSPASALGRF